MQRKAKIFLRVGVDVELIQGIASVSVQFPFY